MNRLGRIGLAIALTVPMVMAAAASAAQRTESKTYYVGSDLAPNCVIAELPSELRGDPAIGGACFQLQGDESDVHIKIEDVSALPVGGGYDFLNAAGNELGSLTLFCESASAKIPAGAASITVYVGGPTVGPAACLLQGQAGGPGTTGTITATYELNGAPGPGPVIDQERDCLEAVPASESLPGITDDGHTVDLTVRVLLDGVAKPTAQAVFARAADAYAPLHVTLSVPDSETDPGFVPVSFSGDDAQGLINQEKDYYNGQRPAGIDIVFLLTTKDIVVYGQPNIVGLADCVGGVRYPERAFAVGELVGFENSDAGPLHFYSDATAKTAAHEIGHLMGAQHHYANCVEGSSTLTEDSIEITPCTLMFNAIDFLSLKFGALEGSVVRGHAAEFAS